MQGAADGKDVDLYQSNDNIYQMLALAFIAALSPDVPKTRYQPGDADNEADIEIAQKASTIQAYNERRNGIKALQKLELLYLWVSGSYFCYTRHVIDKNRAGIIRTPVMGMVPTQILPNRYICHNCATVTPEDKLNPMMGLNCPACKAPTGGWDLLFGGDPTVNGCEVIENIHAHIQRWDYLNTSAWGKIKWGNPPFWFTSEGRKVFQQVGTNGQITAGAASFMVDTVNYYVDNPKSQSSIFNAKQPAGY